MTAEDSAYTRRRRALGLDKLAYLKTVHLFDGLNDAEMRECEAAFPMVKPEKGRTVYTPRSNDEALYIIKDGSVRLYRVSPDGREVTLGLLQKGDVFGTLPMFGAVGRNSFATAETDAVLCIMREEHLGSLISRHPEIALRLLRLVGERLSTAEDLVEDLAFRTAEQRVARALLRMIERSGRSKLRVSHEQVAKDAGVARETATKIVGSLERRDIVRTGYRSIAVIDKPSLETRAAD